LLTSACIGTPADNGSSSGSRLLLHIEPTELTAAVQASPYQQPLSADGVSPLRWGVTDGSLPPGLTLNTRTGTITGTPTVAGTFIFTIAVQDSSFPVRRGEQPYSLNVIPRLLINPQLEPARKNSPYDFTVQVTGGVPPYRFNVVGLPAGLSFEEPTGRIFGTPLNANPDLPLLITATDSGTPQQEASAAATLVIKTEAVSITTAQLPGGAVGNPYNAKIEAAGGIPPYRWAIIADVLPDGLRLNTATGVVSGTPRSAGAWAFSVQVTDADEPASSHSRGFTITIAP